MGSTEAVYLGALAMKKNWQRRRREAGLPADRPNLVFGHNAQVAWQKVRPALPGSGSGTPWPLCSASIPAEASS